MTLHGELYLAPIGDNPKHVLDIGTGSIYVNRILILHSNHLFLGTGVWAIDFGKNISSPFTISRQVTGSNASEAIQHPSSDVLGTDLSAIQPQLYVLPRQFTTLRNILTPKCSSKLSV